MKLKDYIKQIEQFYRDNNVQIDPAPHISINDDVCSRFDPFIPTGNYDPSTNTITLFVYNRHVKDILRTFCHELYHRSQHLSNSDDFDKLDKSGSLSQNSDLEKLEGDAYYHGNLLFRKWTETFTM